jgi:exopolysaccharide biosynthesis protein
MVIMVIKRFLVICLVMLLVGCDVLEEVAQTNENATLIDSGGTWESVMSGVEYQVRTVDPTDSPAFEMHIARFDPALVAFRVVYEAGTARSYTEWQDQLPNAIAFVNGSFFTEDNYAIGLAVVDGQAYGQSLVGYGGMFQIDTNGTARVRSLVTDPYLGEPLIEALQAFPLLIETGGITASTGAGFERSSRRTVIAQDKQGRILLMTTGTIGGINFYDLQTWLLNSGLEIDTAFALDGGRSTGMYLVRVEDTPIEIPSFSEVPVVLAVYNK